MNNQCNIAIIFVILCSSFFHVHHKAVCIMGNGHILSCMNRDAITSPFDILLSLIWVLCQWCNQLYEILLWLVQGFLFGLWIIRKLETRTLLTLFIPQELCNAMIWPFNIFVDNWSTSDAKEPYSFSYFKHRNILKVIKFYIKQWVFKRPTKHI